MPSEQLTTLETARLILRALSDDDVDSVFQLYADWTVAQSLSRIAFPFTREAAQQFVAEAYTALSDRSGYTLGVFHQDSSAFVGIVSLRVPSLDPSSLDEQRVEDAGLGILGYSLRPNYWNQGFATESAARMVAFGFKEVGLTRIQASARQDNFASRRILERLGFRLAQANVAEQPRYGGAPHLVDRFVLVRSNSAA
jgi:8-oxo-dGTP diphosphatase